ncbi:MAG: ABC transporter permease [Acidobacteria bacterium]|nr:MAG: ABC transporter permease [Acidobacteriota bacterium]
MNSPSNAVPESAVGRQAFAAAPISPTRPFYWSVRRELWENRYLYVAPLAVAAIFLFGHLIGTMNLPAQLRRLSGVDPEQYREAILQHYDIAAAFLMGTYILVSLFYCADGLHGERRDRSILFWKSLPVSDFTTVLAKASIPFVILPLLTFVTTLVLQFLMLLVSSAVLLASGLSVATLWTHVPVLQMSLLMLYHIVTAHALWPAPVYCWLLLVSGWARRAALVWAALPVIAIAGVERIAFHTGHFASMVGNRLMGSTDMMSVAPKNIFPTDPMTHITPAHFLLSPGLWVGLMLAAAFLGAAVRLRRHQGPV